MVKRVTICIVFLLNIVPLFSDWSATVERYFLIEKWVASPPVVSGEVRILIELSKINEDLFDLTIYKEMTPFAEFLILRARARYNMGKYEFRCRDGWGNSAFGHFIIKNDDEVILYLNCDDFSDSGKNIGRLYGGTDILTKGTIEPGMLFR